MRLLLGQVTPGPVFTTATFIGFILGGIRGAVLSTVAIFLPALLLVAVSGPLVPRIRKSKTAGAFLDGVNVASLALMAAVTCNSVEHPWLTLLLFFWPSRR
jgi:chromate transporter